MFNVIELNATEDELKPINEATMDFEPSPSVSTTEASKENHVNTKKDLALTKEVETAPIINDPSPTLNRTFRKMVPPLVAKQNFTAQTDAGNLVTTTAAANVNDEALKGNVSMIVATSMDVNNVTEEVFDAIIEEPKKPNRKRVLNSENKNHYPYYLGRVLG